MCSVVNCKQYVNVEVTFVQDMKAYGAQEILLHLFEVWYDLWVCGQLHFSTAVVAGENPQLSLHTRNFGAHIRKFTDSCLR
jgi:hypothetical protein